MGHPNGTGARGSLHAPTRGHLLEIVVLLVASLVFLGGAISPPSLMDDVDAVQAQIARNMLDSGDWVTARLDGIPYLEKSPLKYWMIAVSYMIFGVHDWAARLPVALSAIALCWLTFRFGRWAFDELTGFYAGVTLASCIGLFLFTRILIPDVVLTATITLALWGFLRALDDAEPNPRLWAAIMAASLGTGLLLKGLIAVVFPGAAAFLYLLLRGELLKRRTWQRLHPFTGLLLLLVIAAPWHILASIHNPPIWVFSMDSGPGKYRGFFWFYFFNEHLLRFLNRRWPRDYNTVPRPLFWGLHLVWLFPWSAFFGGLPGLSFRGTDRASRTRLLALLWTGFLLTFFTFSTTQEYYSMPCYPALALLLASAAVANSRAARIGVWIVRGVAALACCAILFILSQVWNLPAPGDISQALTQHPEVYTLSLGHMGDLTLSSFAYLRPPLLLAGLAFLIGALIGPRWRYAGFIVMMVLFLHAARLALVTFDPYLGSRALAEALNQSPQGELIVDDQYYTFSSVFFYTNRTAWLLNGRVNNLEYGSYAPGVPDVFLNDQQFAEKWRTDRLFYIVAEKPAVPRLEKLVGQDALHTVKESGGKFLFANHALLH